MQVSFRNQESKLPGYLPQFRSLPVTSAPARTKRKRITAQIAENDRIGSVNDYDLRFLFCYDIFPPRILKFFGEWERESRTMRPGDVIVQQSQVVPLSFAPKLIFSVRVLSVRQSASEAGFSYGTLQGHPEAGTNDFSILISKNMLLAAIETYAGPGLLLTRLLWPFVELYVNSVNRRALMRMKTRFLESNPSLAET